MIGTSRLSYALAADGLFPKAFARVHPKFKTPYMAVIIQSIIAVVASIIGSLSLLISVSVFFLAIAYLATSGSVLTIRRRGKSPQFRMRGGTIIPILGVMFSVYLISQCSPLQIALGVLLLVIGLPVYVFYSPKKEIAELKGALMDRETLFKRIYAQERTFLAHALLHLRQWLEKARRKIS